MRHKLLSLLVLLLLPFTLNAKATVHLLTTFPSDREVYTLWGHTALVVTTDTSCVVYNYGVFDFTDGFVYKFVSGQTDYCLATDNFNNTFLEIKWKNTSAYLQQLNLTDEEADSIYAALETNLRPENRFYRYKFFSDNCATRPQRLIERFLPDVRYAPSGNTKSYRDKVHKLCKNAPWLSFGIDICLGSEADEVIPDSMITFLPTELMKRMDDATMAYGDGLRRKMVKQKVQIWRPERMSPVDNSFVKHPLFPCLIIAVLSSLGLFFAYRSKGEKYVRIFGPAFLSVMGLVGMLIAFLVFISTHECTSPNFNLLWANPLHLVAAGILASGAANRFAKVVLHADLFFCLAYLLLIAVLPQETCAGFILLTISLIFMLLAYVLLKRISFFTFLDKKTLSDKQRIK